MPSCFPAVAARPLQEALVLRAAQLLKALVLPAHHALTVAMMNCAATCGTMALP